MGEAVDSGATLSIPVPRSALTWDDLQALPDHLHHHYELIEGQILMAPSPSLPHQTIAGGLFVRLRAAAPPQLQVVIAPFDFVPEPHTLLQPDVMVLRRGTAETNRTTVAPVLVVEVLSPSSRTTDRTTKRELYARHGVPNYWIVDPDQPSLLALTLDQPGRYREVAEVSGSDVFAAVEPFAVEVVPARLAEG